MCHVYRVLQRVRQHFCCRCFLGRSERDGHCSCWASEHGPHGMRACKAHLGEPLRADAAMPHLHQGCCDHADLRLHGQAQICVDSVGPCSTLTPLRPLPT